MDKIAIIGLANLYPGSKSPSEFWQKLLDKTDCRTSATERQMGDEPSRFYKAGKGNEDSYYCSMGGYIHDFEFDSQGFALPADYLDQLDDIFKWSLYVAREALKDSGYFDKKDILNACGVILGNLSFPTKKSNDIFLPLYHQPLERALKKLLNDDEFQLSYFRNTHNETIESHPDNALVSGYPSAVVANALQLGGMHYALDAACASSLYAVKLACDHLNTGKADLMLAGAVSGGDPFFVNMGFSIFQAYPENGVHAPLDINSKGLFAGEGAGMLVLKRYDDALRDGDNIYAMICGGGLSNDGKGQHVLSPNSKGQVLAYERAYEDAGVDPTTIDFVECHATGTPLGDKVELTSMETFFGGKGASPLIGSVKSNLGHLLTAAGMPGLSKIILGMQEGKIPGTLNVKQPQASPKALFNGANIPVDTVTWPTPSKTAGDAKPKRAGASVFGFGGCNAHVVLEEASSAALLTRSDKPTLSAKSIERPSGLSRIAIVGMDALFGDCVGLAEFQTTIHQGRQHFRKLPEHRWKGFDHERDVLEASGFITGEAPLGAYIEQFDLDFMHFKIPPNPEDCLIPQQLIAMKVTDQALHDANVKPGRNVAVLVAMGTELELHQFRGRVNLTTQIRDSLQANGIELSEADIVELESIAKDSIYDAAKLNKYTSFIGNIMASRISSLWDFSGPAITISAEENSVFKCIDLADDLFKTSDVEAVVIAAVDLSGSLENVVLRQRFSSVNTAAPGLSFSETNNGWSVGEGAGAVVLKRLDDALADNARIYACIEGVGFAKGSQGNAVSAAAFNALSQAKRSASDVNYIEANASGMAGEDEAELSGLGDVYHTSHAIGSVKANIGHTFSASGMASLIKTALCLGQRFIPAVPQWHGPKSLSQWEAKGFYAPTYSKTWFNSTNGQQAPRVAAINGLGHDDTAAHLILSDQHSQHVEQSLAGALLQESDQLILVKAANQQHLLVSVLELKLAIDSESSLAQIAAAQFDGIPNKGAGSYCLALVAANKDELKKEVAAAEQGIVTAFAHGNDWATPKGSCFSPKPLGETGKVCFVYPGGFTSYLGMGKDLFQLFPSVYHKVSRHTSRLGAMLGDELFHPRTASRISDDEGRARSRELINTPIAMFESGICYAKMLTDLVTGTFKLNPSAAIGYSMGEISMMYAFDIWDSSDQMSELLNRLPVFRTRLAGPMDTVRDAWQLDASIPDGSFWTGFVLKAPVQAIRDAVSHEAKAYLLLINTANEAVIAGDPLACQQVIQRLGCEAVPAAMSDVIHCDIVRPDYDELAALHRMPIANPTDIQLFTAVGYHPVTVGSEEIANNIAEMYCNEVDFPRLVNTAYAEGARIFLEVGPRDSCTRYVQTTLADREHVAVAMDRKGVDNKAAMIKVLAKLASHNVALDLSALYPQSVNYPQKSSEINSSEINYSHVNGENAAKAKNIQNKRGLIKSIELGRKSLRETLLTDQNIQRFSQAKRKAAAELKPLPVDLVAQEATANVYRQPVSQVGSTMQNSESMSARQSPVKQTHSVNAAVSATAQHTLSTSIMSKNNNSRSSSQWDAYRRNMAQVHSAHSAFIDGRNRALQEVGDLIELQLKLGTQVGSTDYASRAPNVERAISSMPVPQEPKLQAALTTTIPSSKTQLIENYSIPDQIIWDTADLVEFAEGKIGNVFGPEFAVIDNYHRRVRLPTTDYLLVTRVTALDATVHEYKPSSMTTEYDIPVDAPYLVDGQIPWAVSVESGQCDLLLISYLGIDFTNKGDRVYRLLDCTLTFLDDLAMGGQTLRYDIKINNYAKNGDALLFFFSYECFVGDKMVLKMDGGCAGFFTDEELADGKGVIQTDADKAERANAVKGSFTPFLTTPKTQYDIQDMRKLVYGDTAACFGAEYDKAGANPSLCFASEKFLMIEQVPFIDTVGGPWGLGVVEGHKQLDPNHWYFPCHFKDDQVMAGSLMAEGCGQLLMFYMLYLGMHTQVKNARFQPMPGEPQKVRCRGQVLPQQGTLVYRMEVIEIGLQPYPYAKANVDIILNGKIVVDFKNISVMMKEEGEATLDLSVNAVSQIVNNQNSVVNNETINRSAQGISPTAPLMRVESDLTREKIKGVTPILHFEAPAIPNDNRVPDTVPYQPFHLFEFATGDIGKCFGPEFDFYKNLTPPRTPCGDLQLTTRVTEVRGVRGELKKPSYCKGEYEVPVDAWYLRGNSHPSVMPYSVLMEISLQPNGFISAWSGTTLRFPDKELFFRNLDGTGTLLREVDLRGKTIVNDSNLLSTTIMGTNIVQSFDFTLSTDNEPFYQGTAVFGYFEADALKNQLGLDKGNVTQPWHVEHQTPEAQVKRIDLTSAAAQDTLYSAPASKPHYRLAGDQLNFIDRVDIVENGGKESKGYIFAERTIDPTDWFFQFHFHEDPVMPGSLGVEAIIQAMQVYMLENNLGADLVNPMFTQILSTVKWKYRGQINPLNVKMSLDIHITDLIREPGKVTLIGDANLSKDGLRIYEISDIAVCLKESN